MLRLEPNISVGRIWDHDNRFEDEWIRPNLRFVAKGQTYFGADYVASKERFGGETFPGISLWSLWFNTRPWERVGFGIDYHGGQGIFRDLENPELADEDSWSVFADFKPSERVTLEVDWDHAASSSREREEKLYSGWILRNRLNLNFTRRWFLRLVVQYNDFSERLDVEPLLTYRVNPFTVFYVGTSSGYEYMRAEEFDVMEESAWKHTDRQFFAKFQYWFRI